MPLPYKDFAELLRVLPADATSDQVNQAADARQEGTPLEKVWNFVNRPVAGSKDALIPALRHEHGPDEGTIRKTAEDLGSSLTSPISLATGALGVGANVAGKAGMLGISNAARLGETALQAPFVAEGLHSVIDGDTTGQKLGGALEAGLGIHGMKTAASHAFEPSAVKAAYMKEAGVAAKTAEPYSLGGAKRTADDYAAMAHDPTNPDVKKSYDSLKLQIDAQHKFLAERAGVKIEPWTGTGEPYPGGAKEMQADVTNNNHLFVLPTDKSGIAADHPMAEGDANDKFRAVHDYFGHATDPKASFGPKGEQAAFNSHRDTLTPAAEGALASETKGQNSWVNAGPHLRNAEGVVPTKGQPGFVPPSARPFAEQKAGLLPEYQPQPVGAAPLPSGDELAHAQTFDPASTQNSVSRPATQSLPPSAVSPELLADINQRHLQGNGSTTNLTTGKAVTANEAQYLLSPYEDRQMKLDHPPTEQDLRNFAAKNEDLLTQPGHNLGTWFNADGDKQHYLDVSIGENNLDNAFRLAEKHKQLAIYDMVNGHDIPTAPQPPTKGGTLPNLGSTALAVGAPAVSAGIDDSDTNDPHQQLKHYAKLGLDMAGLAGFGAAIRVNAQSPQKAAAAKGAAYMLLDNNKANWMKRMLIEGASKDELPKIRAASEKMLNAQLAKADGQMPNAKKLLNHYDTGKPEMGWYDDVHHELEGLFGKDAPLMANLLAATSSNSTVKSNTTLALKAYGYIKTGVDLDNLPAGKGFLPAVVMNIKKAAAGERLAGRKIDNFAQAIQGNPDAVVVDRWMMRAFGFDKDAPTPHQYDVIEHAVKDLAQRQGVTPRQMQAAIWFSVKNKTEAAAGKVNEAPPYGTLLKAKMAQQSLPLQP